jgi:hypothetical protein
MARGEGDQLRGCLAFVEKKVVRLAGAVILSALMLMNLVLAVIAIRSTDKLNGPLGFEIFLVRPQLAETRRYGTTNACIVTHHNRLLRSDIMETPAEFQ